MDQLLTSLLNSGGPTGIFAAVIIVMVVIGVYLRQKGFVAIGDKTKVVNKDALASIDNKLGKIDQRLSDVEHDLKGRPTRAEVHDLDISVAKMDERLKSIDRGVHATNEAVTSINDFMREAALRLKGDK